jgi:hypothetical protein
MGETPFLTGGAGRHDYLRLFDRWDAAAGSGQPRWRDFGDVYQAAEDERCRLLFEQVCHLLVQPSAFNQAMPQEFRATARQWLAGRPPRWRTWARCRTGTSCSATCTTTCT